jgi:hypothetical protein
LRTPAELSWLALTKLNYNACRFGDGKPITLKLADAIGEVLITRPVKDARPRDLAPVEGNLSAPVFIEEALADL